jgi:hypothetical protein
MASSNCPLHLLLPTKTPHDQKMPKASTKHMLELRSMQAGQHRIVAALGCPRLPRRTSNALSSGSSDAARTFKASSLTNLLYVTHWLRCDLLLQLRAACSQLRPWTVRSFVRVDVRVLAQPFHPRLLGVLQRCSHSSCA